MNVNLSVQWLVQLDELADTRSNLIFELARVGNRRHQRQGFPVHIAYRPCEQAEDRRLMGCNLKRVEPGERASCGGALSRDAPTICDRVEMLSNQVQGHSAR